jgi:glutamate synthase domain-containing protein 1
MSVYMMMIMNKNRYGVGNVFFSKKAGVFEKCKAVIEKHCAEQGFQLLYWRDVPTDNSVLL